MTSCDHWEPGTPLPSTVAATYKGLIKACTEEGVPLGRLFDHPDLPHNAHDVTDLQRRIERMAQSHNVQVDMISRLAAERNQAQAELSRVSAKLAELEYKLAHIPDIRVLMYHPESESLFEAVTLDDYVRALDNGCDDVTGNPRFEQQFISEKDDM